MTMVFGIAGQTVEVTLSERFGAHGKYSFAFYDRT